MEAVIYFLVVLFVVVVTGFLILFIFKHFSNAVKIGTPIILIGFYFFLLDIIIEYNDITFRMLEEEFGFLMIIILIIFGVLYGIILIQLEPFIDNKTNKKSYNERLNSLRKKVNNIENDPERLSFFQKQINEIREEINDLKNFKYEEE